MSLFGVLAVRYWAAFRLLLIHSHGREKSNSSVRPQWIHFCQVHPPISSTFCFPALWRPDSDAKWVTSKWYFSLHGFSSLIVCFLGFWDNVAHLHMLCALNSFCYQFMPNEIVIFSLFDWKRLFDPVIFSEFIILTGALFKTSITILRVCFWTCKIM